MSTGKKQEGIAVVAANTERIREGTLDYRIVDGVLLPRPLTPCEELLSKWGECVKGGVKIISDIRPCVGPMWNWDERALYIVSVYNKTGYFRLEMVTVHLIKVEAANGKAPVMREPCSPNVIQIPDIRPGGHASTQSPVASWCDGNAQSPPRMGFTLLCAHVFPTTDTVKASAVVTYRAVPYFEGKCTADEIIVGT
jgi:hypothetical protein